MATLKELVPVDSNGFCSGKYRRTSWSSEMYFEPKFLDSNRFVGLQNNGNIHSYFSGDWKDWEVYTSQPVVKKIRVYKYITKKEYSPSRKTYSEILTYYYYEDNSPEIKSHWIKSADNYMDIEVEEGTGNVHVL